MSSQFLFAELINMKEVGENEERHRDYLGSILHYETERKYLETTYAEQIHSICRNYLFNN